MSNYKLYMSGVSIKHIWNIFERLVYFSSKSMKLLLYNAQLTFYDIFYEMRWGFERDSMNEIWEQN